MFNGYTKTQALTIGGDTTNPCRDYNSYISTDLNGTPQYSIFLQRKKVIGTLEHQTMDIGY